MIPSTIAKVQQPHGLVGHVEAVTSAEKGSVRSCCTMTETADVRIGAEESRAVEMFVRRFHRQMA